MFEKEWLPNALALGVTYNEFWHMNPRIIKSISEGHRLQMEMRDEELWRLGLYVKNAFEVVMAHFGAGLAGKTSQAQYLDKPILQKVEQEEEELSEDEIQRQRELFAARLQIMQANFELSHPKKKEGADGSCE